MLQADAFYLDGFAPSRNPELWDDYLVKNLARLAAPEATAATWSISRPMRRAMNTAGFEVRLAGGARAAP